MISPFSRALQIPRSYDFRSRSSCSSSFLGHRRAGLGLGGKVLLLRLDSQVGQVSLGSDLDVVRRLLVEGAEVPEPAHPRPLCLLEQKLVIGSLLGQLEVLLVPLPVLVGVGPKLCEMYRVRYGGTVPTFSSTLSTSSEGEG